MTPLQVAARNLLRNRRRSLATALTIAIGVVALLLFGGYRTDLIHYMLTAFGRSIGHVLVQHEDYLDYGSGNPALYSFKNAYAVRDALLADPQLAPRIHVATPVINFPAVAGHAERETSKTVLLNGVVPKEHSRMRAWNYYGVNLPSGPHPLDGKPPDAALLGVGTARILQVCDVLPHEARCGAQKTRSVTQPVEQAGETRSDLLDLAELEQGERQTAGPRIDPARAIEVLAATTRGVPNVRSFEVIAAEYHGVKDVDESYVVVDYEHARELLFGRGSSEASSIAIVLRNPNDVDAVMKRADQVLSERFPGQRLVARNAEEAAPFIRQTIDMFNMLFRFISVLILAIVMFTVANTVRTSIMERTIEIGTIRALGLRRSTVLGLFLIEAALLAFAGAVLGTAIAALCSLGINALGLRWIPPNAAEYMPLTVAVLGQYQTMATIVVAATIFSTLAALPAASKAARLNIVEALRHV